jgi:hypothetical protein
MATEERLFFTDDMAVVFKDFGFAVVESAIGWLRQNSEHRPKIKVIRDACSMTSSRRPAKPLHTTLDEYYTDRAAHPERFIPVALIIRDVQNLAALKKAREKNGNPMSRTEVQAWLSNRNIETRNEWVGMVRNGKHLPPAVIDGKQRATGEQALTRVI